MPQENQSPEAPKVVTGLAGVQLPPAPVPAETQLAAEINAEVAANPVDAAADALKLHDEIMVTLAAAKAEEAAAAAMKQQAENPHATSVAMRNQQIYDQIRERRNAPPAVPVQQPVAMPITEQTRREMLAGAQTSLKWAQQRLAAHQASHK